MGELLIDALTTPETEVLIDETNLTLTEADKKRSQVSGDVVIENLYAAAMVSIFD